MVGLACKRNINANALDEGECIITGQFEPYIGLAEKRKLVACKGVKWD